MNRSQQMAIAQKEAIAQSVQNMREFMMLYNNLTERCFSNCAVLQHDNKLSAKEKFCVENCTDRFVSYNQRLMPTFAQNYQERMKAAERLALEQMEKAKQDEAAQAKEQTTPPGNLNAEMQPSTQSETQTDPKIS
ncbi:mitochondrial import inner membrane translocase subunit TIM9-like [Mizuhopecten yessoensis]|uniref:Mitochondrial import inner membrane translocase subunit n=1 Tax=Mizuhopecten yessoensis TaxID=6573 RepID=A0A210QD02_MIZYE|nr:mitochondrial import inner membrane translocase subunit TIM9-like [Mizuhopecten yessoensis]OWF46614.1 Mitochondrial import inner membrane translocase subunit Tim10B [Mizuhopecten yessoensis]